MVDLDFVLFCRVTRNIYIPRTRLKYEKKTLSRSSSCGGGGGGRQESIELHSLPRGCHSGLYSSSTGAAATATASDFHTSLSRQNSRNGADSSSQQSDSDDSDFYSVNRDEPVTSISVVYHNDSSSNCYNNSADGAGGQRSTPQIKY